MLLIQELLRNRDLKIRMHLRAAMELSGLKRILDKHLVLDHPLLRRLISDHYEGAELDSIELADQMKEEVRMNFSDPRGCFDAILANTDGRARDFLTSTLKHLLLLPTEPEARMRHFQLVDRLISGVVTDRKGLDGDFSHLLGSSVAQIIASFTDEERLAEVQDELDLAQARIAQLKQRCEQLQEEVAGRDAGNVGKMQEEIRRLEQALETSRAATDMTKRELAGKEHNFLVQIAALRADNKMLYERLKQAGLLDGVSEDLQERMEKQLQRSKTVQILEGGTHAAVLLPPVPGQSVLGMASARRKMESAMSLQRLDAEERLSAGKKLEVRRFVPSHCRLQLLIFALSRTRSGRDLRRLLRRGLRSGDPVSRCLPSRPTRTTMRRQSADDSRRRPAQASCLLRRR